MGGCRSWTRRTPRTWSSEGFLSSSRLPFFLVLPWLSCSTSGAQTHCKHPVFSHPASLSGAAEGWSWPHPATQAQPWPCDGTPALPTPPTRNLSTLVQGPFFPLTDQAAAQQPALAPVLIWIIANMRRMHGVENAPSPSETPAAALRRPAAAAAAAAARADQPAAHQRSSSFFPAYAVAVLSLVSCSLPSPFSVSPAFHTAIMRVLII